MLGKTKQAKEQRSMASVPNIPTYKKGEDLERWLRGLYYYFIASNITNPMQKKASLMHILGLDVQDIFEILTIAQSDIDLDVYQEACQRLKRYFKPKTNRVYERYLFNEMKQGEETMEDFICKLRVQARRCGFAPAGLDSHICNRAIPGCRDLELKQRLLQKSEMDLTVYNLVTWSTSYGRCRVQAKAITGTEPVHPEAEVNLVRHRQRAGGALAQAGTENVRHRGPGAFRQHQRAESLFVCLLGL